MKLCKTTFLILVLSGVSGAALRLEAQIQSTPATIALNQGGNPQGFITDSAPQAIKFATTEGAPSRIIQLSEIRGDGLEKLIRLEARSEILADATADFSAGNYLEAAKGFAQVVNDYQRLILNIPQNFASEAMFYQIESLRRLGNYKALGPLLASPAGKSIDTMLSDRYKDTSRLQRLWAVFGTGDMAALETALAAYQEPVIGQAKLLPAPNFIKMPQSELAQIAYLRAELYKSKGDNDNALQDYFRVFTMAFGYEPFLTKQAMGAALVIQSQDPALKSDNEKVRKGPLRQIQSVAYVFSKRFPNTPMPDQFKEYAVRPEVDIVLAVKEEEPPKTPEAEAGKEGEKGMDPDAKGKAPEAPDDGKGKAAPPKGKAKAKGKGKE